MVGSCLQMTLRSPLVSVWKPAIGIERDQKSNKYVGKFVAGAVIVKQISDARRERLELVDYFSKHV